jgi:hypothetical protein
LNRFREFATRGIRYFAEYLYNRARLSILGDQNHTLKGDLMISKYVLMLAPVVLMFGGIWFALHPWNESKKSFDERTRAAREALQEKEESARKAA